MTRQQLTRALDMAETGASASAIAAVIGATRWAVRSALGRCGVTTRGKRPPCTWSPAEDRRLAALVAARRTDAEIGRDLCRAATTVRDRRRVLGLHRQQGTVL